MEWLLGAALLIPAGLAARYWSAEARLKRFLRRAKPTTIQQFPNRKAASITGRIRLVGTPLIAPLSRRRCAYYEVVFGADAREAVPRHETRGSDFLVEDGTGSALVRLAGARVVVVKDGHRHAVDFDDLAVVQADFEGVEALQRAVADVPRLGAAAAASAHGVPVEIVQRWLRESLRAERVAQEGVLEEGEEVTVFGYGSRELDPDPAATAGPYRERATRLVVRALFVSDDPSVRGGERAALTSGSD